AVTDASYKPLEYAEGGQETFGTAALVSQFTRHLFPAGADLTEHQFVGDEHVLEKHLVEMVIAGHRQNRTDGHTRRVEQHDELAQTVVPVRRIERRRPSESEERVGVLRPGSPQFGSGNSPPAVDLGGL